MLSYFPAPYPDELLYSLLARYHQWSANSLARETIGELFDDKRVRASVILPMKLGILADKTAPFGLDFDALLLDRSMFPYYTVFNSQENTERVYQWAKNNESGSIQPALSAFGNIQSPDSLRFCTECYYEEQKRYGQAYWHRLHQTPGVLVCERHLCRLLDSNIRYQVRFSKEYYVTPELEQVFPAVIPPALSPESHQSAVLLAHDIRWLYQNYTYIRNVFESYNYTFCDVFVYLLREMEFATENGALRRERFLKAFGEFYSDEFLSLVGLSYQNDATPWMMRMCRTSKTATHPAKYALMARFTCGSLKSFIERAADSKMTINRHRVYTSVADEEEKRERYRARWLITRAEMPVATRNELREANMSSYIWLKRHDAEWLYQNMPPAKKRGGNSSYADWQRRDDSLAEQAAIVINQLLNFDGKPIQITVSRVGKELGCPSLLRTKSLLLPKTLSVIKQYAEDNHLYRLRRVRWATEELEKQGLPIVKWRVMKMANVRDDMWDEYWGYITDWHRDSAM